MAINKKSAEVLDIIYQLAQAKIMAKSSMEIDLLQKEQEVLEKSSPKYAEIEQSIDRVTGDNRKKMEDLQRKIRMIKNGVETANTDPDNFFQENSDLFKKDLQLQIVKLLDEETSELSTAGEVAGFEKNVDEAINSLINEINKKNDYKFDDESMKLLNELINAAQTVSANPFQDAIQSVTDKVATDLSVAIADELLNTLTSLINRFQKTDSTAPYTKELMLFKENLIEVAKSISSKEIEEKDGIEIIKSMLAEYCHKKEIQPALKDDISSVNHLDDVPTCVDSIEQAQKNLWQSTTEKQKEADQLQQLTREQSVLAFNDKINNAAKFHTGPGTNAILSERTALAKLKVIYKELLDICLTKNLELNQFGFPSRGDTEEKEVFIERASEDFFKKFPPSITVALVTNKLRNINERIPRTENPCFLTPRIMYANNEQAINTILKVTAAAGALALVYTNQERFTDIVKSLTTQVPKVVLGAVSNTKSLLGTAMKGFGLKVGYEAGTKIIQKASEAYGEQASQLATSAVKRTGAAVRGATGTQDLKERLKATTERENKEPADDASPKIRDR